MDTTNQNPETQMTAEQEFEVLLQKLQDEKYARQGYPEGSMITIPAETFQAFITYNNNMKMMLESFKESFNQVADRLLEDGDKVSVLLLKQHIRHIDNGETVPYSELDKQDAEKIVNERSSTK